MKCAGLLEAVKIRKSCFEIRLFYEIFVRKYKNLCSNQINLQENHDWKNMTLMIIEKYAN